MIKGDAAPDHPERALDGSDSARNAKQRSWPVVGFEPSYATLVPVPHYYGNFVRELLMGAAALMLVGSPLYGDNIRLEFPFVIVGALASVGVAALTSPRSKWGSIADAIVSGAGAAIFAGWGVINYDSSTLIAFVLRLAIAVIFLFAFYFSMKTVRAFLLGQVGKMPDLRDIDPNAK